jgi:hypothetical protein
MPPPTPIQAIPSETITRPTRPVAETDLESQLPDVAGQFSEVMHSGCLPRTQATCALRRFAAGTLR